MLIKKILRDYLIPPGIIKILRKRFKTNKKAISKRLPINNPYIKNEGFKNKHEGKRCFILATGPSIKKQDLKILKDEITISVGSFFLHEDIKDIKPKYHAFAPSHPPFKFNVIDKIFSGFKQSFKENIEPHVFLGITEYKYSYDEFLRQNNKFYPHSYNLVNFNNSVEINNDNYLNPEIWDISKSPFALRTVVYLGIQIAVYMGCKEIYLIGCDHDYLNDTSRVTNHHFYDDSKSYSDKEHLESFSTERWFYEYYMRWKQYRLIKEYCISKGIKIINATDGGMLDVFERVDIEELFNA